MLQCESGVAGAALLRLYRMLRVGELLALVALVSWSTSYVPSAAAAALRLAGSLLLNARFVFVLGNAIVLLLFALSRHDLSPSSSGDGDNEQQTASSTATTPQHQREASVAPVAADGTSFDSLATPMLSSDAVAGGTPTTSFATPPPPTEALLREAAVPALEEEKRAVLKRAVFEEKKLQLQPAVVVNNKARAPRRSLSEKMGPRLCRAASPELRRCESENGCGGRRRSSVTARDAEACWGREDADEFRRQVEAFIARQTRFHREESMLTSRHCEPAPAFTGALAVVE